MNKRICPGCGWRNNKNLSICPDCGQLLESESEGTNETPFKTQNTSVIKGIITLIIIILFMTWIMLRIEEAAKKEVKYLAGDICSTEKYQLKVKKGNKMLLSEPHLEGLELGYLKLGECYEILDLTNIEEEAGWLYIKTADGTQGYLQYNEGNKADFEIGASLSTDIKPTITTTKPIENTTSSSTTTSKVTTTTTTSKKQVLTIGEIEGINENFTSGYMTCKVTALSFELSKQNYSEILTININGKMSAPKDENDGRICNANLLFYDSENNLIAKHMIMAGPLSAGEESEFRTFTFADVDYSKIKGPLINVKIEPFTLN